MKFIDGVKKYLFDPGFIVATIVVAVVIVPFALSAWAKVRNRAAAAVPPAAA